MTCTNKGLLLVVLSALSYSTLPIFTKIAYLQQLTTGNLLFFRFALAAILLIVYVKIKGYSLFDISLRQFAIVCALGIGGYAVMSGLFLSSVKYISPSLTALILYTYPVIVFALSLISGTEKFSLRTALILLLCVIGVIMVLGSSLQFNVNSTGLLLSLGAAIVYALYIVVGERINRSVPPIITLTYVCLSASLCYLLLDCLNGEFTLSYPLSGWITIIAIAVIPTIIACFAFFEGMALIGACRASIISNIEPVSTVILSFMIFGDLLHPLQFVGGLLVLTSVILLQTFGKKQSANIQIDQTTISKARPTV